MFATNLSRRQALKSIGSILACAPAVIGAPDNDIQIVEAEPSYVDYRYRAPMKFGGSVVDRVTLLNVRCTVRGRNGKTARGYGSMPDYKQQVPVRDRWAIVGYIRALQLSQHFPKSQLTEEMRQGWEQQKAGAAREEESP